MRPDLTTILGQGWTYCPRCDADSMVKTEQGWHCPWCGISMMLAQPPPISEVMLWSDALDTEQVMREMNHIQQKTTVWATAQAKLRPPKRVCAFIKLCNLLGWLFGCRVQMVLDKTVKEGTSEQERTKDHR